MDLLTRAAIAMAAGIVTGIVGYMVIRVAMAISTIALCALIAYVCLPEIESGSAMDGSGARASRWSLECMSIPCVGYCFLLGSNVNASPP